MTDKEKQLVQDMKDLVADINHHFENTDAGKRIPAIELEILSSNIRALYDKSILLKYLQATGNPFSKQEEAALTQEEKQPEPQSEVIATPKPEPIEPPAIQESEIETPPEPEQKTDSVSTQPKPKSDQPQTVAERFQRTPIQDLRKAIGINQKYLLMNDLFDGENEAFNEAVDRLNSFASGQEAITYVNAELAVKYRWNLEEDLVQNFINLVERRYL